MAHCSPAAPAAADRGPGLLPGQHRQVSHLPVLRLAPVKENRSNCPFLTENHCAIHDAERWCARSTAGPGDQPGRAGELLLAAYRLRRQVIEARVQDYLSRYDVPAREALDVRWGTDLHGAGG